MDLRSPTYASDVTGRCAISIRIPSIQTHYNPLVTRFFVYHKVLNKHSQECAATRICRWALNPCRRNMSDVSIRLTRRDVVEPWTETMNIL